MLSKLTLENSIGTYSNLRKLERASSKLIWAQSRTQTTKRPSLEFTNFLLNILSTSCLRTNFSTLLNIPWEHFYASQDNPSLMNIYLLFKLLSSKINVSPIWSPISLSVEQHRVNILSEVINILQGTSRNISVFKDIVILLGAFLTNRVHVVISYISS